MNPKMILNVAIKRNEDGSKHVDLQVHGVIDGGWFDDAGDDTSSSDFVSALKEHANAATVDARFNSVGGSLFGGVAMHNALAAHPGQTRSIVEGLAASAASLAALGSKKVVMGRGAMMMIHSPSGLTMGNAADHRKSADMLDKAQQALASIYTAKTGKSLDEINEMLNAETWLTAEDCVKDGFADEIGTGEAEPDPADPKEPKEPAEPQSVGESVIWAGVVFPKASLPAQIVAMAKAPAPVVAPVLNIVPKPAEPAPLTRAEIANRAPEILAALRAEGHVEGIAAGIAQERARLQAIDKLDLKGCANLVDAAKYGDNPTDAAALCVAVVTGGKAAGFDLLANRRKESAVIAGIEPDRTDNTGDEAEYARTLAVMVKAANQRLGGTPK